MTIKDVILSSLSKIWLKKLIQPKVLSQASSMAPYYHPSLSRLVSETMPTSNASQDKI